MKTRPTFVEIEVAVDGYRGEGGARQVVAFWSTSAEQFPVQRRPARRVEKPAQVELFRRYVVADNEHIARALHRPDDRLGQLVAAKRWQE